MAEISPPLNPLFELPDPVEAARQLASRIQDYKARTSSMLDEQARQISQVHQNFLKSRQQSLDELSQLLQTDILSRLNLPVGLLPAPAHKTVLFSKRQLEEFAVGDIEKCFGPAYSVFHGRRSPRIPNGQLLLMSRVTAIEGQPGSFDAGSIEVEYDCPAGAWYLDSHLANGIPNAILMEVALQPCGFLSAYLHTPLISPQEDLYFRNLDGTAQLLREINLAGKTITARAKLLGTSIGAGMILQSFAFEMLANHELFYSGEASFGYFPAAALAAQSGLDGSQTRRPWFFQSPNTGSQAVTLTTYKAQHPLETGFNSASVDILGGNPGIGYAYAQKAVDPGDWYFSAHFHQDPVMPGSLGVEALYQMLEKLVLSRAPFLIGITPHLISNKSAPLVWKYRGQIQPSNQVMEFEVHLQSEQVLANQMNYNASGSVWVDGKRIYEVSNLCLGYKLS